MKKNKPSISDCRSFCYLWQGARSSIVATTETPLEFVERQRGEKINVVNAENKILISTWRIDSSLIAFLSERRFAVKVDKSDPNFSLIAKVF